MNKDKRFLPKIPKTIGLILVALFFYFLGYLVGHQNLIFEQNYKPKVVHKELVKPKTVDFGLFWDAWNKVGEKYVGKPDTQKMVYGAISGMISALGDPYSAFMEPNFSKNFLEDLSGEIQGIGAEISLKDKQLIVVSPLSDSPAQKAGLKPNDQILKIDEEQTEGLSLDEAISKIRGKAGTKVKLAIIRDDWKEPQIFEITRAKIIIKSVEWQVKDNNIAYIKITQFGDDTMDLLRQAVGDINKKQLKTVILDVRHNPGGYLDAAVEVTSLFLKEGVVVKEQYKDGHIEETKTKKQPETFDGKILVLINDGSASASEIVAGALQDAGRAILIGQKTFGKGSVQELEELKQGAALRLTVAKWLTPKGRSIDNAGIEPDVKVDLSEEDQKAGRDPQLDKALELAR